MGISKLGQYWVTWCYKCNIKNPHNFQAIKMVIRFLGSWIQVPQSVLHGQSSDSPATKNNSSHVWEQKLRRDSLVIEPSALLWQAATSCVPIQQLLWLTTTLLEPFWWNVRCEFKMLQQYNTPSSPSGLSGTCAAVRSKWDFSQFVLCN